MSQTFLEVKQQIRSRSSKALQLCREHDLNIQGFIEKTYHKFFDLKHRSSYYYADKSQLPFKETLKKLDRSKKFEVMNIQQFEIVYQISYVDLEKLNSRIDEITNQQTIEVEIQ